MEPKLEKRNVSSTKEFTEENGDTVVSPIIVDQGIKERTTIVRISGQKM